MENGCVYVDEAGHNQVYVVAFPKPGGRFLVGDGQLGTWNRNGKEIIYLDDHSRLATVEVTAHGESVELGKPQILFRYTARRYQPVRGRPGRQAFSYDAGASGEFLQPHPDRELAAGTQEIESAGLRLFLGKIDHDDLRVFA
jgi:hypothetical protein